MAPPLRRLVRPWLSRCRPVVPWAVWPAAPLRVPAPSVSAALRVPRRHLSATGHDTSSPPPTAAAPTHESSSDAEGSGEEDDARVRIYRPPVSPEDAERRVKTDVFLCLVLTLPRAQDWRDMVTAAVRAGTWRPHHLDAVLRGVQLNRYNAPAECVRGCLGGSPAAHSAALRDAVHAAASAAPQACTPTQRLLRARDVLVMCAEEGRAHAPAPPDCAPTPAAVHRLLALLLQAAQRGAGGGAAASSPGSPAQAALPAASFHDVWHFLAWMELHGYHVLSAAVLDDLEAAVDEGAGRSGTGTASLPSTTAPPRQHATVSQRVHRLDYLRGERARLQQANMSADGAAGGVRRRDDAPRTAPSHTE
ncbi:hypothetical protein NESM_000764900 [Novymonas esmeraldas]|uniref:Uncharacterized protein n=1 Tax=Novymonas esmeraldas TaxID=1808958 RepID=A0AAW0EVC5_9TRYP